MDSCNDKFMARCLQLAKNGFSTTYPNPMVGSVIVYNNVIIGEGWHLKAGEAHAEVHAINSVKNKDLLSQASIYVSLEPCSHFGKTPPCADLIIKSKIPHVIIGTIDPNNKVAGQGIEKLKKAGIKVTVGVLEKECLQLNRRFFTSHQQNRPYIILKWAQSADGFMAPVEEKRIAKSPFWISNAYSRQIAHKWRCEEQSILVGSQTVLEDNPKLNSRFWQGKNPCRVIIDKNAQIPLSFFVLDESVKTIYITENCTKENTVMLFYENIDFSKNSSQQIVAILQKHQLQSVIIEGGKKTLDHFIKANLWDEARIFVGKNNLLEGLKAPYFIADLQQKIQIKEDTLKIYTNK